MIMGFFDFDKYKGQKVAMHCKTEEEAIRFCRDINAANNILKKGLGMLAMPAAS